MIKRLILLVSLICVANGLAGCDYWGNRGPAARTAAQREYDRRLDEERRAREQDLRDRRAAAERDRRDRGYDYFDPPPPGWLSLDFACSGVLRRAQWLICENDNLGLIHRRLALQWEAARRVASPERIDVLMAQQQAFLRERNACENIACVTASYNRYLDGSIKPGAKPGTKGLTGKKKVKHGAKSTGHPHGKSSDGVGPYHQRPTSCAAEIGFAAASQLASRCDDVTPTLSSQCTVQNSCGGIRTQIDRGCAASRYKPGFCRAY